MNTVDYIYHAHHPENQTDSQTAVVYRHLIEHPHISDLLKRYNRVVVVDRPQNIPPLQTEYQRLTGKVLDYSQFSQTGFDRLAIVYCAQLGGLDVDIASVYRKYADEIAYRRRCVVFYPSGRLGNALIRYLACVLLCIKYNLKFCVEREYLYRDGDDNITEERFLWLISQKCVLDRDLILNGVMQLDFVYNHYKPQILEYIKSQNHTIQTDVNDRYRSYTISELLRPVSVTPTTVHLRLGDVLSSRNHDHWHYVAPEWLFPVYARLHEPRVDIVCTQNNPEEIAVVERHKGWFRERGVVCNILTGTTTEDFRRLRCSTKVVCTHSSFSWMAVYLSDTVKTCYSPDYNYYSTHMTRVCFRNPLINTVLYPVATTRFPRIRAFIISLQRFPERTTRCLPLIFLLNRIGITVQIHWGVDGDNDNTIPVSYKYKRLTPGEIGCAKSHLQLYNRLSRDSDYDVYLILEDDAVCVRDCDSLLDVVCGINTDSADLFHLSRSDWNPFRGRTGERFYTPTPGNFNRATGYILTRDGAKKLKAFTENKVVYPADDLLSVAWNSGAIRLQVPDRYVFRDRPEPSTILRVNGENTD